MTIEEQRRAQLQAKIRARNRAKRKRLRRMRQRLILLGMFLALLAIVGITVSLFSGKTKVEEADTTVDFTEADGNAQAEDLPEVYTIVLDSGHSTYNAGAHGIVNEEDITAATTEYLRLILESDPSFEVILTHEYDDYIGIAARRQVGIDNEADFFISIHCNINADDSSATGFEVYAQLPENANHEASHQVASDIANAFIEAGRTPRIGTGVFYCRYVTDENGNDLTYTLTEYDESVTDYGGETYGVIKSDAYPGILVEQGYVTSQTDVENWMSDAGMQKAAQIYYAALCDYFGTEPLV